MDGFGEGTQARIHGLKGEPALNGLVGVSLGPSLPSNERLQVRLASGRELSLRPQNLALAGASAGTLAPGDRVVLAGLSAAALNSREGTVKATSDSGRFHVALDDDEGPPKALKASNLVLLTVDAAPPAADVPGEEPDSKEFVSEKAQRAKRINALALKVVPLGSTVRIHGIVEEKGLAESGDPLLNGEEGVVEGQDPDEPGRFIVKLPPTGRAAVLKRENAESRLRSFCYKNLTPLSEPPVEPSGPSLENGVKRPALADAASGALQVVGANGKRCKLTEVAIASGDKTAAFASAARNRGPPVTASDAGGAAAAPLSEAARSNALIYARTDAVSPDDEIARPALARLVMLCSNFAMKAICVLGKDILENGKGQLGSKAADAAEALATFLTGKEVDGILRKRLSEGQECAGEKDGLAACRRCAEKSLKGDRLLSLLRRNAGGIKDFLTRGCKER